VEAEIISSRGTRVTKEWGKSRNDAAYLCKKVISIFKVL
jgi:hypothetical protein